MKDRYVDGDWETLRKSSKKRHCYQKLELLICFIRLLYLEASIDMHTAACLYLETEHCTKKRFGESDTQTERTSTKKRHLRIVELTARASLGDGHARGPA